MNHRALTLTIAAAVFGTISPIQADLLFYEGFNYTDATQLHGQGGWSNDPNSTYDGTTPATVSNTGSDDPFEIFDGTGEAWDGDFTGVTQSGNFGGYAGGHLFATRSLDPSVTSTFTDGSTTWLSFINYRTSSRGADVSIGAGPLTGDRSQFSQNENIGMGPIFNNASSRALTWAGAGAQYVTSATLLGDNQPQFLIAKIVWSDTGNDTITVVKFLETDTISEANFNTATQSTLSANFNQSLFDTINIGGAQCFVDEIRIATTFADAVSGVPIASVPDPVTSSVAASPGIVPNDGTTTSTITVTLRDDDSVSVPSRDVTLTGSTGNATITPVSPTTNVSGQAVFTVSSVTPETETFTAEDVTGGGSIIVTQTASVIFEDPDLVDPATSTVTASLADVPADDSTTSTVTVTLKTSLGTPIQGKDVSLAAAPTGATITALNATTDVNGEAAFTVRSAIPGTVVFTATDITGGGSTAIPQTTSVVFTVAVPTPTLLFHEPFDYADGSLLDAGTFGGWDDSVNNTGLVLEVSDGTGGESWDGDFTGVTQTGNFAGVIDGHMFATRTLDPSVTAAFTDGSVSWLSFISYRGVRGALVSIGAGPLTGDRSRNSADQNMGMGHYYSSANSRALTWAGGGAEYASGTLLGANQPQFLVAKIVWSDTAPDTITVVSFPEGATINEAAFDAATQSVLAADFDQSLFDTINIGNAQGYIDEIRIATTLDLAVNGTGPSGDDYDAWALDYPGLGLPGDDDDGDGLSNDEERIFGLNPTSGASANPISVPLDAAAGTFSYTRRTQSLTGLTYKVWYSINLEEWFEDTVGTASQDPGTPTNDVEIVGVTIDPALLAQPKLFIQVSAEDLGPPPPPPVAPELSALWGSGTSITLNFTEEMNATPATNTANYTVELDGGGSVTVTGASLSGDGKTVTLTLGAALGIDSAYNVLMSNLAGSSGQPLGGSATAQFRTWDNDPNGIKVFILAGQSNMVGHGKSQEGAGGVVGAIGSLRYLAVNDASYPDVDYSGLLVDPGQPATSAWATRSDVKVWWKDGYVTDPRTIRKGNHKIGYADSGTWFGPEYAFGRVMGDHFTAPVLIIKTAWGGIDLAQGFRPPSAVARGGVVGPYYNAILNDVREVLTDLATQFPAAQHPEFDAVNYRYQIVGFGWHQGWNDGGSATFANEYEENLADLIDDLRVEFGQPALPVAIANSGFGGVGGQTGDRLTVRQAQDSIGSLLTAHPVYSGTVLTDDTAPYWRSSSVSPSNFGFHWNHNAESHYLIGKGMADKMKTLLP